MRRWTYVNLLSGVVIFCMIISLVFGEGKEVERVAGIWVIDKDKMQQESERLLEQARAKAEEMKNESTEEQLKRLEDSHKKDIDRNERRMLHLNEDGSGGVFLSLVGLKGMRGPFSGPSLLLWKAEGDTVKFISYSRPIGYTKPYEYTLTFEGHHLVTSARIPALDIKPDETNLLLLFRFNKHYFKKIDTNDPVAQKPKILSLKEVQLKAPEGFEESRIRYTTGYPEEIRDYINHSNQKEKIKLTLTVAYGLGKYNRPGEEQADHDKIIAILTKGMFDKVKKNFPEAVLSTGYGLLDEMKAGYLEGTLTENYKDTQETLYTKHYILVDDGVGVLDIAITAGSIDRVKFIDDYVKKIKLNMEKTWTVTLDEVMEAKRKTEEYMKSKSGE